MNKEFMVAVLPYRDRIEAYFALENGGSRDRFEKWLQVMGHFTDTEKNPVRDRMILHHARSGKQVLVVIPERAHPMLYFRWFEQLIQQLKEDGIGNVRVLFSGGVTGQTGTDGKFYSFEDGYGEFCAARMDDVLRRACPLYRDHISAERVTLEGFSKNTGDQACMLANLILGSNSDLVVFLGPAEHVPRFALTVHCGIRTYESVFRKVYKDRLAKMQMLVYPLFRNNGWDGMTDMRGMTSAQDAFGPLDTDETRLKLFPKKIRGRELVERIGEEMYGANAKTFIMNVTTVEDALFDPLFELEFTDVIENKD